MIQLDAASNASSATSTTTLTWSHTVGPGANRLLVVCVHCSALAAVSGITFGAQSFTKVRHDQDLSRSEIWYLENPAEGADTITITFASALTNKRGSAVSLFGVDQTAPLDAQAGFNSPGSGTTSFSASITTIADNAAIVDCLTIGGVPTITMGTQTNRVERFNAGGSVDPGAGQSTLIVKTPAGAQTMNWTLSDARRGGLSVASFKPATTILLAGNLSGSASLSGALTTQIPMQAAVSGQAAVQAFLTTEITLEGQVTGAATLSGNLSEQGVISLPATAKKIFRAPRSPGSPGWPWKAPAGCGSVSKPWKA